jgi:hypothetical protein
MKQYRLISTALVFLGLASSVFAYSQGHRDENQGKADKQEKQVGRGNKDEQQEQKAAPQAQPEQRGQQQEQKAAPQAQHEQRGQQQHAQQKKQVQPSQQANQQRQDQNQQHANQNQQRVEQQGNKHQQPVQAAQTQQKEHPPGWDKGKKVGWGNGNVPPGKQARYSPERQQQLIGEQQQRVVVYRQRLDQQEILGRTYSEQLQQERRLASYRFQQEYLARLQQQQLALQRSYNYNNDPYFYTASIYRYNRGGSYYELNQYGADTLRKAINFGYSEGFRSGQADRQDRYSSGYQNSYAYQDANYGYDGYYGDQDSYNYYFRQGFSRGYEDGYNSRYQYGSYSNGNYSVLGNILSGILNLQALR